jgi:flagellar hook-associated protein 2
MTVSGAGSSTSNTSSSSSPVSSISTSAGSNTSSTIDWNALIQAAVAAKLTQATQIQTKITANQAKITAYQGLQSGLSTLAKGVSSLATSVVNSLSASAFAARAATITTTGNVNAASVLSMTVKSGAATGAHSLTIQQIATANKITGASQSSQTAALGYSGSFTIGLAGGGSQSISISSGMSLSDVADAINAQSPTTNVEASIIQVSSTSYQLVLTGTQDAADITYSSTSGDDILNKLGMTDNSGNFTNVLQTAQSAQFTLDGIALTRDTNDVSDVLAGVTFSLLQPTPTGSAVNINIGTDADQISSALQTFVTNYNAFRDAVVAQQATNTDGTASSTAVLYGDGTMRQIMDQLQSVMNTSVNGMTMADLGLSFNENNELELDTGTLSSIISTNLSGVTALLSAQTTTSSGQLIVANTGSSPPSSFTLDITVDGSGNLTGASVGGDNSLFTISGNAIIGNAGTIYAGMAFTYTGSTSQSIAVTSTSGLAAQIYQVANTASSSSGALQTVIDSLTDQDSTMQSKVNDIQSAAAAYQAQLQVLYSRYQAAIQSANNMLNYLKAIMDAGSKN